jgi:inositol transport system substrate-binding protein
MKKAISVLVAVFLVAGILVTTACQKKERAAEKILIGFARSESNDAWLSYLHDGFADYFADKPGYEIIWSDGQNDVVRQQDDINSMIARGVKALVVIPVDTSAMGPITKAVQDAGIPLIYVNRSPFVGSEIPKGVYYCGSDAVISGRLEMEYLGQRLGGKGNVAILLGQLNHEAAQNRRQGFMEIIREKYPDIKIVAEQTANWMRNEAVSVVENWIAGFPDIDAIAAQSGEMAMGAIAALESVGRKGILVGGMDGLPDHLQAVKEGRMACCVYQNAIGQGSGAADYAVRALNGENLEPIKWIPYELVTQDNVDDYIKALNN